MPKSSRVICHSCRAQLGVVLADRLTVAGHTVEYTPRGGLVVICTVCKTPRPWSARASA